MSQVFALLDAIREARVYTRALLDATSSDEWFLMPGGVSHVCWQVGHLAMAEYRLCLERIRGRLPEDEDLIDAHFLRRFGRGSIPAPNPANLPPPKEVREVFDRVHDRVLAELHELDEAELDRPPREAHRLCETKGQLLGWCSRHEMFHAGQLALLRRLIGKPPIW